MLARLGAAIVLTMGVMMFTMPLYGFDVYEGGDFPADGVMAHLPGVLRYASLLATSIVLVLLGLPLFTSSWEQLRQGVVTTDLLIVIGVAAAVAYSYVSTVADSGRVYFETACVILVLVTLGRYLEASGKNQASATLRALESLLPDFVDVQRSGQTETIPRRELGVGDLVWVQAGARIPVDGRLLRGQAHIDEGVVTGESTPAPATAGDTVRAGALNLDGHLLIEVTAIGAQSTLGRLLEAVSAARREKTHFERMADRAVRWFLPVVLTLALLAGGAEGYRRGELDSAIMTGLAVLLISCPCALGIATPLAAWVAVDQAAKRGIVFRSATALEALAKVQAVAFDKTGTMTDGAPTVSRFDKTESNGYLREELIAVSGALAATSLHSVSRGVAEFARVSAVGTADLDAAKSIPGRGIAATWGDSEVRLGSASFVSSAESTETVQGRGQTHTYLGVDGRCVGVFSLLERLRPEAKEALSGLARLGCRSRVLTGDSLARAMQIADELGVPVSASLLPEDKLRELSAMRAEWGAVVMVGDGLNDTPALTLADIGVAMGCGADVTRDAADVCLLGNDLRGVPWAIALARRASRIMKMNLVWAAAYNVVGIPLAATGRLSPAFAALAMVVSSLLVLGNSLRLQKIPPGVDLP